ncbi:MAG: hypothetical protein HKN23_15490 [Verrucomicrobiales bacterium]|nr:hypothetical protein [Verrucomicrobiales bacterium]
MNEGPSTAEGPDTPESGGGAVILTLVIVGAIALVLVGVVGLFFVYWLRTEQLETEINLSLPAAGENAIPIQSAPGSPAEIIISVQSGGEIQVNAETLTKETLAARLEEIAAAHPDQAVVLRADPETDFQKVIEVLDQIKAAAIWNVAFSTTETTNDSTGSVR